MKEMVDENDNPRVGTCSDCGSSIWAQQARLEEEGKLYHATCRMLATQKARYEKILAQAEKALHLASHRVGCDFTGCTCGATASFKIESGEFFRQLYQFKTSAT